jgi:DnaJ-class molecular chaperone
MMPQHAPAARICRDCDGFPTVAITTGTRNSDGTRATLRVTCPTCQGTGTTRPTAVFARSGK